MYVLPQSFDVLFFVSYLIVIRFLKNNIKPYTQLRQENIILCHGKLQDLRLVSLNSPFGLSAGE